MRFQPFALSAFALMLAACGGSGGSSNNTTVDPNASTAVTTGPKTITVFPALGVIHNADVTVSSLDGKTVLSGNTGTGSTGSVTFTIPATINAVVITVKGTSATYFDEAARADRNFPAGFTLRAATLVTSDGESFAVTPLTNAAVRYAETTLGGINSFSIVEANDKIAGKFDIANILLPPVPISKLDDFANLQTDTNRNKLAAKYAILLTAFSQMALTQSGSDTAPAATLATELAEDLSDGRLDGKPNATPVTTYTPSNMPNGLKKALKTYVDNYLTTPAVPAIPETCTTDIFGITSCSGGSAEIPAKPKIVNIGAYNYLTDFIFSINSKINSNDPDIVQTNIDSSMGNTDGSYVIRSSNVTASELAKFQGTYTGKSLGGKNCTASLNAVSGLISISEEGVVVTSSVLDGGNEDSKSELFNAAGVRTSLQIFSTPSSTVTRGTYLYFVNDVLSSAGDMDPTTGNLYSSCAINK